MTTHPDIEETHVAYCDPGSEHPDNARFLLDVEKWLDHPIRVLRSDKYADTWDVFEKSKYLVGPGGARCTMFLKKRLREDYQRASDIQVFGFDSGEEKRASRFKEHHTEVDPLFPLIERKLSKSDCLSLIEAAGIETPAMYKLGYEHNNCVGCVKGGAGYWNKIRVDFPEVFERMAKVERELDVAINKKYRKGKRLRVFLDELDPKSGRPQDLKDAGCSVFCQIEMSEMKETEDD
jgi:hypothetical protein